MKTFDPFRKSKKNAFFNAIDAIVTLAENVMEQLQLEDLPQSELKKIIMQLVKVISQILSGEKLRSYIKQTFYKRLTSKI